MPDACLLDRPRHGHRPRGATADYAALATGRHRRRTAAASSPAAARYDQLEGNDRARNVLVEFPDLAAAEACYRSPDYQAALAYARGAAERDLVIVEGVAP